MWKTKVKTKLYSCNGIHVFQNILYRWLQFDSSAIQTLINRYLPERPELSYLKPLLWPAIIKTEDCCMLGLGGGGLAHALSPYLKSSSLSIVESNAEVIDIAKQYFMIDRLKNIHLIHQDAAQFLEACPTPFRYLIVDLFTASDLPSQCSTDTFFSNCKQALKPGGIMAVNLANVREHWPVFQLMQQQFSQSTLTLPIPGSANMIIFAQKSTTIIPYLESLNNSRQIKKISWDSKWGYLARI